MELNSCFSLMCSIRVLSAHLCTNIAIIEDSRNDRDIRKKVAAKGKSKCVHYSSVPVKYWRTTSTEQKVALSGYWAAS